MARKKIKIAWIVNDAARRASLKKRRTSLLKKVKQIISLCNVHASAIIYSPNDNDPMTWPPERAEVVEVLRRFQNVPELDRTKKMMDQVTYLRETITKLQNQLAKNEKRTTEIEITHLMSQLEQGMRFSEFNPNEQQKLASWTSQKIKEVRRRMSFHNQQPNRLPPPGNEEAMIQGEGNVLGADDWLVNFMNQQNWVGGSSSSQIGPPFGGTALPNYDTGGASEHASAGLRSTDHIAGTSFGGSDAGVSGHAGVPDNAGETPQAPDNN